LCARLGPRHGTSSRSPRWDAPTSGASCATVRSTKVGGASCATRWMFVVGNASYVIRWRDFVLGSISSGLNRGMWQSWRWIHSTRSSARVGSPQASYRGRAMGSSPIRGCALRNGTGLHLGVPPWCHGRRRGDQRGSRRRTRRYSRTLMKTMKIVDAKTRVPAYLARQMPRLAYADTGDDHTPISCWLVGTKAFQPQRQLRINPGGARSYTKHTQ
jgi:hypothetical protein